MWNDVSFPAELAYMIIISVNSPHGKIILHEGWPATLSCLDGKSSQVFFETHSEVEL